MGAMHEIPALTGSLEQDVQFALLVHSATSTPPKMDGDAITRALMDNRDLWSAVLYDHVGEDRKLFDLMEGQWTASSLFIASVRLRQEQREELERLARSWGADEVVWVRDGEPSDLVLALAPQEAERFRNLYVLRVHWNWLEDRGKTRGVL